MARRGSVQSSFPWHLSLIGMCFVFLANPLHAVVNSSREHAGPGVPFAFWSLLFFLCLYVFSLLINGRRVEETLVKYQAAVDASADGISILNSRYECVYLNKSYAMLYGYASHSDLMGKPWRHLYPDTEFNRFENEIAPLLSTKGEWRGETVGRKRDGRLFPQDISLTSMGSKGVVCIVRDVTERNAFEEELQQSNRELEAFGYSLSHDLRNYLARCSLAIQMLQEFSHLSLDETDRYCFKVIRETNHDMEELVTAMLTLSRVSQSEVTRERVDLTAMATEIAAGLSLSEPERQVSFIAAPDLVAAGDPHLLKIALENLLGNAWKFTRQIPEPRVEFGVMELNGSITFFARDNGIGFDMKEAGNLFEPFRRLKNAAGSPGTGIGLATVQRIFQRHGGKVWAEGEVGAGATFFFTITQE